MSVASRRSAFTVLAVTLMLCLILILPSPGAGAAVHATRSGTSAGSLAKCCLFRTLWSFVPSRELRTGDFIVTWDNCLLKGANLRVSHASDPVRTLWENNRGKGFISAAIAEATVTGSHGFFDIEDSVIKRLKHQTVDRVRRRGGKVVITGHFLDGGRKPRYSMTLEAREDDQLGFDLELQDNITPEGTYNRTYLAYSSSPDEHFYGFGEQFSYFDLKGRKVPILCEEQGIGRGLQPLTFLMDLFADAGGSWHSTYAAVPHYITNQNRSLFLEDYDYSEFDLRCPYRVEIKQFASEMNGRILNGDSPLSLIEEYTEYSGRMLPLPDWVNNGAIVGMQGGTERVLGELSALQARDVPVSAFWLQDWVGKRHTIVASQLWWNWEVDREHYPNWEELIQDLRDQDIRMMTYMNPMLTDVSEKPYYERNMFEEALELGYLVEDESGEPYMIESTTFSGGLIDLTNPDAREWVKDILEENYLDAGVSGWMADYAEALPFDCVLDGGQDPASYHNRFPEEWARLHREAVAEAGMEGEVAFFSRSGYSKSPSYSSFFWTGDQLTSWDEYDGIKTAVTGMLSGGMSGYSINHSDIGGYTTIGLEILPGFGIYRTKELLLRWMEMNAFTAAFRTHEGSAPALNYQFYTDEDSYRHFERFAKVYKALGFYRDELMDEAASKGYPVVRHPVLHYPDDPEVHSLNYQFMLGSEFMVGPVLDAGAEQVDVYLPAGEWVHLWSGEEYGSTAAGSRVTVPAPLGEPAVFYRKGSPQGQQLVDVLTDMGIL